VVLILSSYTNIDVPLPLRIQIRASFIYVLKLREIGVDIVKD